MNCREFEDQISAAVDRYLTGTERSLFDEHAKTCATCRQDFESERQTKELVQARLHLVHTPPAVLESIRVRLDSATVAPRFTVNLPLFRMPAVRYAFGIAAVVLVAFLFGRKGPTPWEPGITEGTVTDMIGHSHATYDAMIGGGWQPEVVSNQPDHVKGFFAGKTDFPVHILAPRNCTLVGGSLNEVGGTKVAHVLYKSSSGMIWVCQVCVETAMRGERLRLPVNARRDLEQTGWHTQTLPDGDALVLWTRGATLCSAVAHMPSEDLMAALTSENDPVRW